MRRKSYNRFLAGALSVCMAVMPMQAAYAESQTAVSEEPAEKDASEPAQEDAEIETHGNLLEEAAKAQKEAKATQAAEQKREENNTADENTQTTAQDPDTEAVTSPEDAEESQTEVIEGSEEETETEDEEWKDSLPEEIPPYEPEEENLVAFDATEEVDGVQIHVSAPEGVFPEGTSFHAEAVQDQDTEQSISDSVDQCQGSIYDTMVKQYCYDLTMLDKDGNEIEPDISHGDVSVTFKNMSELTDPNLNAEVYHIDDDFNANTLIQTENETDEISWGGVQEATSSEKTEVVCPENETTKNDNEKILDEDTSDSDTSVPDQKDSTSSEGGSTQTNQTANEENTTKNAKIQDELVMQEETSSEISVQTTAFSFYVVRFSYETKTYDVCAGETIPLATILSSVNLSGTPSAVTTNDTDHITLTQEDSSWSVTAKSNISSDAKITVTISDVDYDIAITLTDSYDFFALLFEDGTLAFINKDHDTKPLEETYGTVLHTYPAPEDGSMHGWSENDAVKHVVFLDPYAPTSIASYFSQCTNLTDVDSTNLNLTNVTDANHAFDGDKALQSIDFLSEWDAASLQTATAMFSGCSALTNVSPIYNWKTSNLQSAPALLEGTGIVTVDLSKWTIGKNPFISYIFHNCTSLEYANLSGWDLESKNDIFPGCTNLNHIVLNHCTINLLELRNSNLRLSSSPVLRTIEMNNCETSSSDGTGAFAGLSSVTSISLSGLKAPNLSNMTAFFNGCTNLKACAFPNCYAPNLSSTVSMFYGCQSLRDICIGFTGNPHIQQAMSMFEGCAQLQTVTWTNATLDAGNVNYSPYAAMFSRCYALTDINFDNWTIRGMESLDTLFATTSVESGKPVTLSIAGWTTDNILRNMSRMFASSRFASIDMSGWKGCRADNVTDFSSMFIRCTYLKKLNMTGLIQQNDNTEPVDLSYMFDGCSNFDQLNLDCLQNINYVKAMRNMFYGTNLESISLPNINLTKCVGIDITKYAFASYRLQNLNISNWTVPYVIHMADTIRSNRMISSIIADNWTFTNQVTNLNAMYNGIRTNTLSIQNWNCPGVTSLFAMFAASDLTNILWGTTWNTGEIASVDNMFAECKSLTHINLNTIPIDFSHVTSMEGFAVNMPSLNKISFGDYSFEQLQNIVGAFAVDPQLQYLDLSKFNSQNITSYKTWLNNSGVRILKLGENVSFANGEDENQLPADKWKNIDDGRVISLWTEYDGKTMAGTYVIDDSHYNLNETNFDTLSYDSETGTVTAVKTLDAQGIPANIPIPKMLASYYDLDASWVKQDTELWNQLQNNFKNQDLTLNAKTRFFLDNSSCSKENNTIWTFNVPKDNTEIIRMDIYDESGKNLYGYITNDQENKSIFTFYDASGAVKETLIPGKQHTYRDLGYVGSHDETYRGTTTHYDYQYYGSLKMTESKLDQPIYPSYEKYISYQKNMNNYEVVMPPRHSIIELYAEKNQGIILHPSEIKTKSVTTGRGDNQKTEEMPDKYIYSVQNAPQCSAECSVGNQIYQEDQEVTYTPVTVVKTCLKKVDQYGNTISGAGFGFWKLYADGNTHSDEPDNVVYTDGKGKIEPYFANNNQSYLAKEIHAPSGYNLNSTEIIYTPELVTPGERVERKESLIYSDTAIGGKSNWSSSCETCMRAGALSCTCKLFGSCRCDCCGISVNTVTSTTKYIPIMNVEKPDVKIAKEGTNFSAYDKKHIKFQYTLTDLTANTTISFSLFSGDSNYLRSNEMQDGHRYRVTEESYISDTYQPKNSKIGVKDAADQDQYDYATTIGTDSDDEFGYHTNATSVTFVYNEKALSNGYITFRNTRQIHTRDLCVSKKVDTSHSTASTANEDFHFTLSLSNETLDSLADQKITFAKTDGTTGNVMLTDGKYEFTLKGGEKITFSGIPDHTAYTVEEADSPQYLSRSENATGTIYGENANVTFTNEKVDLPFMPNTGGIGRGGIYGTACIIGITSVLIYTKKRRRRL